MGTGGLPIVAREERRMLVICRFRVTRSEEADFLELGAPALAALAARPGHVSSRLARALDEPEEWVLVMEWSGVGAYRRALGAADVRVRATALLARAVDEATAYEVQLDPADTAPRRSDRAGGALDAGSVPDDRRGGGAR
jgi:quinol monooxygenase YgiN